MVASQPRLNPKSVACFPQYHWVEKSEGALKLKALKERLQFYRALVLLHPMILGKAGY